MSVPSPTISSTLVIVCCHAIYTGGSCGNPNDEAQWLLAPFQKGETPTFIAHAEAGVKALRDHDHGEAILVFSGGPTKREQGCNLSEAESYHVRISPPLTLYRTSGRYAETSVKHMIQARQSFTSAQSCREANIYTERHATDSLQNLLFSLLLFCELKGRPPSRIVLITHAFKRRRFVEGHCRTIRWPAEKLEFVGIDPPGLDVGDSEGRKVAEDGEEQTRRDWEADCWGWGEVLGGKRRKRSWQVPIGGHDVMLWEGGSSRTEKYPGHLPWDE